MHPTAWEYQAESDLGIDRLNQLGEAGWELVGVENRTFYLKRARLSLKERVTLEQKRRYYATQNGTTLDEGTVR